jgi:hypothetical protein
MMATLGKAAGVAGAFVAGEQVVIKREQEVVLGKLYAGLSTLKEMARTIDDELEGQNKLLESIDNETDKAQGSMDQAIKSIEKLLGTSNTCQLCTILSLVVIFVIGACRGAGGGWVLQALVGAPLAFPHFTQRLTRTHARAAPFSLACPPAGRIARGRGCSRARPGPAARPRHLLTTAPAVF